MFIIFGHGSNNKNWLTVHGDHVYVQWSYFHVFWLPIAYSVQWFMRRAGQAVHERVSYREIKETIPENTPRLGYFRRYGLLVVIGTIWLWGAMAGW